MPGCCLPQVKQRQLPQLSLRGSITRPTDSLCTLRSLGYPNTTQHSVPTASTLGRTGLATCRVPLRSFSNYPSRSLLPGFAWRTSGRRGRLLSPKPGRRGHRIGAPTPTERSVRISRTTLFSICFTAQLMTSSSHKKTKIFGRYSFRCYPF